ncbi:MAG: sensor histidine kinase, partial [Acidobacteriota bacterium]|nr:sensor histidine kinase [Acidobacteriota bacterium]
IEAQEAERQSIARELHDQIGQVLTAIQINLQTVWKACETLESRSLIDEGIGMVDQALEQVRDLSFELRPSLLDDLGLPAALRWYADRYAKRAGIRVSTNITFAEFHPRLPRELETACFRIMQEALTNVARHAQAKNVLINLGTLNDRISLSIKDDGIGFDRHSRNTATSSHPLGLRGMQERALALGGKLEINSVPSQGTEICAQFPNGTKESKN